MIYFIIFMYIVVALMGAYLFSKLYSRKPAKIAIGVVHGLLGLFGISLLIIYTSFLKGDTPYISILLFVLAFMFGGGMFAAKLTGKRIPKLIAFLHIGIAVTGIGFLISFCISLNQ